MPCAEAELSEVRGLKFTLRRGVCLGFTLRLLQGLFEASRFTLHRRCGPSCLFHVLYPREGEGEDKGKALGMRSVQLPGGGVQPSERFLPTK